jgi:hypothetical protein
MSEELNLQELSPEEIKRQKHLEAVKRWNQANKEKRKGYKHKYYENHKEYVKEYNKNYYQRRKQERLQLQEVN